jgi:hypothetical protein
MEINMEDKLSDIQTGFRDLASDIEYRFAELERDKAYTFTVESLSQKVFELENTIIDLKEELEQQINDAIGD